MIIQKLRVLGAILVLSGIAMSSAFPVKMAVSTNHRAATTRATFDSGLFDKLTGLLIQLGINPDNIEVSRYAIEHPGPFSSVAAHASSQDYPFFALVGAVKAARDKDFKGIGRFNQKQCESPIAFIDKVFGTADTMIDNAKGKQDTNAVVGVAKEYAADYAKAVTAQAKQEAIDELNERVPYFGEIRTICSFAFETNFQAEKDLQNLINNTVQTIRRAYLAFSEGNVVDGVAALLTLGAKPELTCDFVDQWVSNGLIGRLPVLGTLAKGACKGFTGKVFDGATGLVKGGVGIAEAGVSKAVEFGNSIGCKALSLIGNGCSSAVPPDPNTLALNSATAWCSTHDGLKGFSKDSNKTLIACNDGSLCQQSAGEPMRCVTAAEKAANDAQRAQMLQADIKSKLLPALKVFVGTWQPMCPDSNCYQAISDAGGGIVNYIQNGAKADPTAPYTFLSYRAFQKAEITARSVVHEAEFRVYPTKWANDFSAYWVPRCLNDKDCLDGIVYVKAAVVPIIASRHKKNPDAPHSAMSIEYATFESTARKLVADTRQKLKVLTPSIKPLVIKPGVSLPPIKPGSVSVMREPSALQMTCTNPADNSFWAYTMSSLLNLRPTQNSIYFSASGSNKKVIVSWQDVGEDPVESDRIFLLKTMPTTIKLSG